MAVRNRVVWDFVTEEPLSRRQLNQFAKESSENGHAVVLGDVEDLDKQEIQFSAHVHTSSEGLACPGCVMNARDELS